MLLCSDCEVCGRPAIRAHTVCGRCLPDVTLRQELAHYKAMWENAEDANRKLLDKIAAMRREGK